MMGRADMSDLTRLIKSRRSANLFMEGIEIPDQDLNDIFNELNMLLLLLIYSTRTMWWLRIPISSTVYEAANKHKILTASAVIVVLGNKQAYKDIGRMNEGFLNLGVIDKLEYDMTVESVTNFMKRAENPS